MTALIYRRNITPSLFSFLSLVLYSHRSIQVKPKKGKNWWYSQESFAYYSFITKALTASYPMHPEKTNSAMHKNRAIPTISGRRMARGSTCKTGEPQHLKAERKCPYCPVGRKSSDLPRVTEYWASTMEL